ncbi:Scr1 family TA system antitoxin-like transcriptional regulator [Nocardiopsis kunsanensis]
MLADFEAEASTFRTYESQVIPGLLQTPQYADAIFRANLVRDDDEIDRRVEARVKRQGVLNRVDPPTFMALIDEAALRRMVGTSDVMQEQLRHLTQMASRHNINIYVLPFSAGAHPSTEGSYVIMDFTDLRDASIAYLETPATSMYLEEEHQVRLFNDMFGSTQSCAMAPVQSLAFINRLLQELEE